MKFYNREKENKVLQHIERLSASYAQMTVDTGAAASARPRSITFVGLSMDDM